MGNEKKKLPGVVVLSKSSSVDGGGDFCLGKYFAVCMPERSFDNAVATERRRGFDIVHAHEDIYKDFPSWLRDL